MSGTAPLSSASLPASSRLFTTGLLAAVIGCSSAPPPPPTTSPAPTASAAAAAPEKREPAMNVLWQYRLKQPGVPQVDHLATNAKGDLLIGAGHASQALAFKLDSTGQPLWRASLDTYRSWFGGVGLDDTGNAYATAWFDTDVTLAGRSITGGVAESIYVLKLDTLGGKKLWSRVPDGSRVDSPRLSIGPRGEVFVAGNFENDLAFGAVRLPGHSLLPAYGGNVFVAELDASGKARWAREFPTNGFVTSVIPDGTGNILLSGNFWGTITFDRSAPLRAERPTGDRRDYFFAKLDPSGEALWARRIHAHTVVASPLGTGESYGCALPGSGPAEIKKFSADGRVLLTVPIPEDGPSCASLAVDQQGMIYVAGEQDGKPSEQGGRPEPWQGVMKLDESGKVISRLALVPDITLTMCPQIALSNGKLFVAGARGSYQDPVLYLAELTL